MISDTDPLGVERQAEMARHRQANWSGSECSGPGCPEQDSSWQEYESYRAALQSADQYGMPALGNLLLNQGRDRLEEMPGQIGIQDE